MGISPLNLILYQYGSCVAGCLSTHNPRTTGPSRERIPWYNGSERIVEIVYAADASFRNIYIHSENSSSTDAFGEYSALIPPLNVPAKDFIKEQFKNLWQIQDDGSKYPGFLHTAQERLPAHSLESALGVLTKELLPYRGRGKVLVLMQGLDHWNEFGQSFWRKKNT